MARVRVGLVLVGVVVLFWALWLNRPTPPTPTEIDAARMQRVGERLVRVAAHYPRFPSFYYVMSRMEVEEDDDLDLLSSAREPEVRHSEGFSSHRGFDALVVEGWRGYASPKEGLPYFWDKHDDPDGYRLVARLQAVEGGWTVAVERMRAEELDKLCERYELELR